MKKLIWTYLAAVLLLAGAWSDVQAQNKPLKSYPEDLLAVEYPYFTTVKFKGKAPGICDFITANINDDGMPMDTGDVIDAWNHYLRGEPQEKGSELIVDKKNGYVSHVSDYTIEYDDGVLYCKSLYEMCFWNCADGKHKLFAMSDNSMVNGRFKEGQTTGIYFYLYDNARHIMWQVVDYLLGAEVDSGTEEGYEYNAETKLHYVKDRETGEPLALNEEEFYKWLDEKPVVVYRLPREGKDIIVEIQRANRTDTVRLEWDGMMFNRK